jgi:hypothetical protein
MIDNPSEAGSVRHCIEPHAARTSGDVIEEGLGPVCGQKTRQLCLDGDCEGVVDLGGPPRELRGCRGCQALCRCGTQLRRLSMQELPACRRCAGRCGERVQVGGGRGEDVGVLRRRGNESSIARCRREVADTEAPLAQREMVLEDGGRRVQPCCSGVGLADSLNSQAICLFRLSSR